MTDPASEPVLVPVATAARVLGCSPRTIRRRILAGELAAVVDHGRTMIRTEDLHAYVDRLPRIGSARPRRRRPRAQVFPRVVDKIELRQEIGRAALERPRP